MKRNWARHLFLLSLIALPLSGSAEVGLPAITLTEGPEGTEYSLSLQLLALMSMMTFLPAMLMMMTAFTRVVIVMAIVRQALGMPTTPSNQVVVGLALFLTFFIMTPVFEKIHDDALMPYMEETIGFSEAVDKAQAPLRSFMVTQTRRDDLDVFMRISHTEDVQNFDDIPILVLIPAFVTSELKTAFQMGFMIFLPFLVIDIVIASVLMSMGMMMLSPMIVSLPFKIMLFVLVDGWSLVIGTLASSFGI